MFHIEPWIISSKTNLFMLFFLLQIKHVNGLAQSPNLQLQTSTTNQLAKSSHMSNGIRSNSNITSAHVKISVSNGRDSNHPEPLNERNLDQGTCDKGFQLPVFAKPFRVPSNLDQIQSKIRPVPTTCEAPANQTDGGRDVESILKMMTSTLEPLTKNRSNSQN